ncbi:hypothetical protein MASR2M78_02780 [Treponema sp.]
MDEAETSFEVEGRRVLGLSTGLDPISFAQAKLAQLLSDTGTLVHQDGTVEIWRPEGVVESKGIMVIWGPNFQGTALDQIFAKGGTAALNALRLWLSARAKLEKPVPAPSPGTVYLDINNTLLFLPQRLGQRHLLAQGKEAQLERSERWLHPDRKGLEADLFTASALAYAIFSKKAPFAAATVEAVQADIRDGLLLPSKLAAPGLDTMIAKHIDESLFPKQKARSGTGSNKKLASTDAGKELQNLSRMLGSYGSKGLETFFKPLTEKEAELLSKELIRYQSSQEKSLKIKRFTTRNKTALGLGAIGLLIVFFIVRSFVVDSGSKPSTKGMSPREVIQTYYGSFGTLDHGMMEACVIQKAGKGDIDATMNLFVISRVREAYEHTTMVLSAEQWINDGSPLVNQMVYGTTDLAITETETDESDGELGFRVEYSFWHPAAAEEMEEEAENIQRTQEARASKPEKTIRSDELRLVLKDGRWRIAALKRSEQ